MRRQRVAVAVLGGVVAILIVVPAGGLGRGPVQPDGSGPVPPSQPDPLAGRPQPDGREPLPPLTVEVMPTQPPQAHPDGKGRLTQVEGPDEPDAGVDGADRPGGRTDAGGVDGRDEPGGRED